jgi:sporulation protein YqfC
MNRKNKQSRLDRLLELPKEISSNEPKITIQGYNQMVIENYKTILDYQDIYIRIKTYIGIINITGIGLKLNEMTSDDIMIYGEIDSIDFEKIED